jgi:hypothetical protein
LSVRRPLWQPRDEAQAHPAANRAERLWARRPPPGPAGLNTVHQKIVFFIPKLVIDVRPEDVSHKIIELLVGRARFDALEEHQSRFTVERCYAQRAVWLPQIRAAHGAAPSGRRFDTSRKSRLKTNRRKRAV